MGSGTERLGVVHQHGIPAGRPSTEGYLSALMERGTLGILGLMLNLLGIPLMLAGIVGLLQLASPRHPLSAGSRSPQPPLACCRSCWLVQVN
ncbi:hypothetical protein [Arthrobacter sp. N199823]|uniref:hypothetical protein n=1 Tax=Arthrobacter sp. N199823 TaxID=2058895 RepID=UPI0011B0617F|nr:hypothetical protein [Arthrobacter sp. N199823]